MAVFPAYDIRAGNKKRNWEVMDQFGEMFRTDSLPMVKLCH